MPWTLSNLYDAVVWCDRHDAIVTFLPRMSTRDKNRVAVTVAAPNGYKISVGGFSLLHAVQKMEIKLSLAKMDTETVS